MNILHIIFSFNNGGSENLVVDLLNSWKNKKDKLYLCIVNDFYDEELLNKIKNENVKIIKLNRKVGGKKTDGMKKLRNIVKKEKIDVIHCHSVNVLNYAFLALGYSFKRKYILTIHNVSIYGTLSHKLVLMHKFFLHKITAISETVKNSVVANGFPDKKIDVIYKEQWNQLIQFEKIKYKYILAYVLHEDEVYKVAERISKETGLKIICLQNSLKKPIKANYIFSAGPEEFLSLIKEATYVVTDSFHGAAFSIIYRKTCKIVLKKSLTDLNGRLNTLVDDFDIKESIVDGKSANRELLVSTCYDEKRIQNIIIKSKQFLENILGE